MQSFNINSVLDGTVKVTEQVRLTNTGVPGNDDEGGQGSKLIQQKGAHRLVATADSRNRVACLPEPIAGDLRTLTPSEAIKMRA